MTTPNCTHCNDTGRLPGSDYFDCAHCDVAKERTELGEFAEKAGVYELAHVYDDALFAVHRRATAIGRASALAELHPNWLAEKERADRAEARIAELEAQIAAVSAPIVERQTWSHITPRDFVEVATAIMDQHGLMDDLSYEKTEKLCEDMEASFKKLPHPVQADTDKLREALEVLKAEKTVQEQHYGEVAAAAACGSLLHRGEATCTEGVILGVKYCINHIEEMISASTALQAPVREVPGWISVDDRRPTDHTKCYLVFSNWGIRFARKHEDNWANGCFQDTDSDSDEGMLGWDSVEGPFTVTHWMELPALPAAPVQEPKP